MTTEEMKQRAQEYERKALGQFPLKLIETTGDRALAKWQELKSAGSGTPVILGGDETDPLGNLLTPFGPDAPPLQPVEEILRLAAGMNFPADLARQRKADEEAAKAFLQQFKADRAAKPDKATPQSKGTVDGDFQTLSLEEVIVAMEGQPSEPPLGEWPAAPETSAGLTVVRNVLTNKPFSKVYVGIVPTDDWTTIPAYLRWGGWNECPAAEYHVAAMRTWRDRYGAELIGMSADTLNLRVAGNPQTRGEALALARDQYVYCADIIDQGFQTYNALAADLMANDWWYFWWD